MFCPKCGTRIHDASHYCVNCGARLSELGVPSAGGASPTSGTSAVPNGSNVVAVNPYAGFWRRVAASIIDSGVIFIAAYVAALMVGDSGANTDAAAARFVVLSIVGTWLYCALMESSSSHATLGKMALGIKVTDLRGDRIGFGRATGRYWAKFLSSLSLCIGYVMAGFTRRRQSLHDKVAGTLVVKKAMTAADLVRHPEAPHVPAWGTVLLIVLAVGIPVTGMFAAIAIPAYQDYTIRSQIAEGLMEAASYKAAVAEAAVRSTAWDDIDSASLGFGTDASSKYLTSIEVISGAVVLRYGKQANAQISDGQLVLVPGFDEGGNVVWVCGRADPPDGVTLAVEDYQQYTGIANKYLPAACRASVR